MGKCALFLCDKTLCVLSSRINNSASKLAKLANVSYPWLQKAFQLSCSRSGLCSVTRVFNSENTFCKREKKYPYLYY